MVFDDGRPHRLAGEGHRRWRQPYAGDRPLLLPLDLLQGAEWRAVRDRHDGPRLLGRRAEGASGRTAVAAAGVRAPARAGRGEPHAAAESEGAVSSITGRAARSAPRWLRGRARGRAV